MVTACTSIPTHTHTVGTLTKRSNLEGISEWSWPWLQCCTGCRGHREVKPPVRSASPESWLYEGSRRVWGPWLLSRLPSSRYLASYSFYQVHVAYWRLTPCTCSPSHAHFSFYQVHVAYWRLTPCTCSPSHAHFVCRIRSKTLLKFLQLKLIIKATSILGENIRIHMTLNVLRFPVQLFDVV